MILVCDLGYHRVENKVSVVVEGEEVLSGCVNAGEASVRKNGGRDAAEVREEGEGFGGGVGLLPADLGMEICNKGADELFVCHGLFPVKCNF